MFSVLSCICFLFFCKTLWATTDVTQLKQENFTLGTFRITSPGVYHIVEDIVFNPNPGSRENPNAEGAWMPLEDDPNYESQAYVLGFFAAITIEVDDVQLDLKGHTIKMDPEFHVQQRFYAHIEIGRAPFEINQGPADFGGTNPTVNIKISNGKLGLSSHHGVHGNSVTGLVLKNLKIFDFEVGGIQLNNFEDVRIEKVEIGPSLDNLRINGYYSNARFLLPELASLADRLPEETIQFADRDDAVTIDQIYAELEDQMDAFFRYAVDAVSDTNNHHHHHHRLLSLQSDQDPTTEAAIELFSLSAPHVPDGGALYGILLNSFGAAVQGFADSDSQSENIVLLDVTIRGLQLSVTETIGFIPSDVEPPRPVRGPHGDVLSMLSVCAELRDSNELGEEQFDVTQCTFQGNALTRAQIALALYANEDELGTTSMGENFLNWATGQPSLNDGNLVCNGDVMFHTIKGIVGIRIDNTVGVEMRNVKIEELINRSNLGSNVCGTYSSEEDDNAITGTIGGYMGGSIRGICGANVKDIQLHGVEVRELRSFYGDVIGIDSFMKTEVELNGIALAYFNSGTEVDASLADFLTNNPQPNSSPLTCGLQSDLSSTTWLSSATMYPRMEVCVLNLRAQS